MALSRDSLATAWDSPYELQRTRNFSTGSSGSNEGTEGVVRELLSLLILLHRFMAISLVEIHG